MDRIFLLAVLLIALVGRLPGVTSAGGPVQRVHLEMVPGKISDSGSYKYLPQTMRLFEQTQGTGPFEMRVHNASLNGGITSIGEYFTRIKVGGQDFRVQVDTGSSTLAIPLVQCRSCHPGDLRYSSEKSATEKALPITCASSQCGENTCRAGCSQCIDGKCCSEENPSLCGFFLRYGDGSGAQGALMYDQMEWGGLSVDGNFGGILKDSRNFEQDGVDGIMGLAYPSLGCTPTCMTPIFDLMVNDKLVDDIFSICLAEHGGVITLGDYDSQTMKSQITWVPMVTSYPPTFYTVSLPGYMRIGKRDVNLPKFNTAIVDSGTTLLVVSTNTFLGIAKHLKTHHCDVPGLCGKNSWFQPAVCVTINDAGLALMPKLSFLVGPDKEVLELLPEHYMLPFEDTGKKFRCVGIMTSDGISEVDVILGNTLNMRYVTTYDRKNSRMGFSQRRKDCGLATTRCESFWRCEECAAAQGCEYNYSLKGCFEKNQKTASWFPYPSCSGPLCFCRVSIVSAPLT
uniref:Peptidase A1 domain-containing protein n=2 Tax=Rhodosorus marinus TaxID=101924 RepID=A0A7S3EMD4_9RHOD|mmetsp:Transcript_6200/g.26177  ORF Transcript_6200/g.26177 Transcript_6200/m.26177 type:complete len:512 (+) Transcript_6200:74-1609(+)